MSFARILNVHLSAGEEYNSSDKIVIVEEELDGTDIYGIGKLVDFSRLMFINEERGYFKVVVDGGQLTRNNDRKKSSEVLQAHRCLFCDTCFRRAEAHLGLLQHPRWRAF